MGEWMGELGGGEGVIFETKFLKSQYIRLEPILLLSKAERRSSVCSLKSEITFAIIKLL